MFGVDGGGLRRGILYHFIGGQTYFSTSWHDKMILTLSELIESSLYKSPQPLQACILQKLTEHGEYIMENNQLQIQTPVELNDVAGAFFLHKIYYSVA